VALVLFAAEARAWAPPVVGFEALLSGGAEVRDAVAREGLLQVAGVPALGKLRHGVLSLLAKCASEARGLAAEFELADGALRKTIAAATQQGKAHEIALESVFGQEFLPASCVQFEEKSAKLRDLVTRVSNLVFAELDALCGTHRSKSAPFARSKKGKDFDYPSVQAMLNAGHHLEHFHVYEPKCEGQKNKQSLEMHTDDGLFIALIPSLFVDGETFREIEGADAATGFFLENGLDEVVRPEFQDGGDVILFMMGQGATAWTGKCSSIRAVPHTLVMSDSCWLNSEGNVLRSWYGRMFQAPRDAVDEQTNLTYGELHAHKVSAVLEETDAFSAGCTPSGDVLVRDLAHGCADGEMLCWMQCRPWSIDSGCTEGLPLERYKCKSPEGLIWEAGDTHCPTCRPNCLEDGPIVTPGTICNGYGTAMYMLGFSSGADPLDNCVVLLFRGAILDTPTKMAFASIGVFLFGMFVEMIVWQKRKHKSNEKIHPGLYMTLHIAQVTFGYFAMLIAMTYSAILFICIVLGLSAGHYLFNLTFLAVNAEGEEQADPCCSFMNEDSIISRSGKPSTISSEGSEEIPIANL